MNLVKWLLLIVGAAYFYYWFKGKERTAQTHRARVEAET